MGILVKSKMKSSIALPPPGTLSGADKKQCLKEEDVVIPKEDNPIRGTWRLEIVDSVKVSSDGLTRSVRLRMSVDRLTDKGKRVDEAVYLDRPIHKLVVIGMAGTT